MPVDVHQHLWPERFVEALRRRTRPPRLDGWRLELDGEPPYDVTPADHDPATRAALASADGLDLALVGMSSPLGIESLPPGEAGPLLDAWHDGALELPPPFRPWAAPCLTEIDPDRVAALLDRGCAGLQLPATALLDRAGYDHCAPLLELCRRRRAAVFVHPGPTTAGEPAWWAPLVGYVTQLHTAWYAFLAFGRERHPGLRICFAMLAGLAPAHDERLAQRAAGLVARGVVDPDVFVETSSYGPRGVDAIVRVLGVDVVVHGSDRPYAVPVDPALGEAASHAFRTVNPSRLLALGAKQ